MRIDANLGNQNQRGSALIVAIFLLILFAAASAAITHMAASSVETTSIRIDSERAFYAAESARIVDGDVKDLGGDETLQGRKNPDGSEYPNCGSANLFIGYVGESWGGARARHALCAGGESLTAVDLNNLDDYFKWVVVEEKMGEIPRQGVFAGSEAHFTGVPHQGVEGPVCVSKDAKKFSGLSGGNSSFNFVFFEGQGAVDKDDWDKTNINIDCAYGCDDGEGGYAFCDFSLESEDECDSQFGDNDLPDDKNWCAASSGGSSGGPGSWGYADFSGN